MILQYERLRMPEYQRGDTRPCRRSSYGIAAVESHTGRIEIIPPIFVVSFTLFSPLNINGHMLSGVMAQEVTTAYNTRVLTLFYCLQISSIVFSYTSILSRICPLLASLPCSHPFSSSFSSFSSSTFFIGVSPSLSFPFTGRLSFSYRSPAPLLFISLSLSLSPLRFSSFFSSPLFSPPTSVPFRSFSLSSPPAFLPPCPGTHVRIIYIVMHIIFHLFPRVRVFSAQFFFSFLTR